MSHYEIYVVKNVEDKEDYAGHIDEETMFGEMQHCADYVEEVTVTENWMEQFKYNLDQIFGPLNVERDGSRFKIFKAGPIAYFEAMREQVLDAAQEAMNRPIQDFINIGGNNPSWYLIREILDSNYDSHFYIDGFGCRTRTQFAQNILWMADHAKADNVTLELRQVFDFHA